MEPFGERRLGQSRAFCELRTVHGSPGCESINFSTGPIVGSNAACSQSLLPVDRPERGQPVSTAWARMTWMNSVCTSRATIAALPGNLCAASVAMQSTNRRVRVLASTDPQANSGSTSCQGGGSKTVYGKPAVDNLCASGRTTLTEIERDLDDVGPPFRRRVF